jgi:phosphoribosylanthranilate isomerase
MNVRTAERPRVKICGITREEDARLAVELGAWALGFVFAEESPRRISLDGAAKIIATLAGTAVEFVGVFVDATREEIAAAAKAGVTIAQLHGYISPELVADAPIPVFVARSPYARDQLADLARFPGAEALLIDGYVPGVQGGTGVQADWSLATEAKRFHPRVILAGGLRAENLRQAIATVRPYAIDASSALESSYGVKDPAKLRGFFAALPESA